MDPLAASDVAEAIEFILQRPSNVNISDMTILPSSQASSTIVRREL